MLMESKRTVSGPVGEVILKVASRVHPGLIVMGMHPAKLPEWSTRTSHEITQQVQREACCAILSVRG